MDGLIHAILVGVLFTIMGGIFVAITRAADKAINKRKINTTNELANDTMKDDDLSSTTKMTKELNIDFGQKNLSSETKMAILTEKEKQTVHRYKAHLMVMKQSNDSKSQEITLEKIEEISHLIYYRACDRLNIKPYTKIDSEQMEAEQVEAEQVDIELSKLLEDEELDIDKYKYYSDKKKYYVDRLLESSHRFTKYWEATKYLENCLDFYYKLHIVSPPSEDRIDKIFNDLIVSTVKILEAKH